MTEISTIIAVSALAYLATNMDNLAILTALFAKYRGNGRAVVAGHLLVVGLTLVAAGLIGEASNAVSVQYLGYLGIVPVALGLFWIYRWFRPAAVPGEDLPAGRKGAALAASVLSLLSNSTDTLLTQAVVFADTAARLDWVVAVTVFIVAGLLAAAALYGVSNPRFGPRVERHAGRIAPFIMIAVGAYVFANTATDVM